MKLFNAIKRRSKASITAIVAAGALGLGLATIGLFQLTAQADTAGQVGSAPRCNVNVVGPTDSFNINDKRDKATVRFTLQGTSNCKVRLSANSFYAPTWNGMSGDGSYKDQTLFDRMTYVFAKDNAEHALSVGLPTSSNPSRGCYWQVDLTYGIENVRPVLAYDHGRIDGGQCAPTPPPTPPTPPTPPVTPPTPPTPPATPQYACQALTLTPGAITPTTGAQAYTLMASATAQNVTIVRYDFNYDDGTSASAPSAATAVSLVHTYAPGEYDPTVTVTFQDAAGKTYTATAPTCAGHVSVKPLVKKFTCDKLTATPGAIAQNGNQTVSLAAAATAQNVAITGYTFSFGDGSQDVTVNSSAQTTSTSHTYAPGNYTARVTVNSADDRKTSDPCTAQIKVAPKQDSNLVCSNLQLVPGAINSDSSQSFTFKATASKTNATITSYVFNFGDNSQDVTITTGDLTANTTHTYAPGNYNAKVTVTGKNADGNTITAPANTACTQPVTVTPPLPKNPAISLTKTVDGVKVKSVAIGQNFTYQLVIKNTGEKDLTNAVVTDAAPQGVTLVSADLGTVTATGFSYTIPSLAVGQSVTVNITATIKAYIAGNVVNTACVDTPDITGQPDACDTATVTVPPVVTPPTTPPAQVLGVTTLVNTGPGSVAGIVVAVIALSAVAHRFVLGRKFAR